MRIVIRILTYIFLILLFIWLFKQMSSIGYDIFADKAKDTLQESVETSITVGDGESILDIAKDLAEQDIVENPYLFAISLRCMENYTDIRPGEYKISSSEKPSEILKKLTHEEEQDQ